MGPLAHRPLRRTRPPAYPTRQDAAAQPDLLRRHVPRAWLTNRELAAAVGVFLGASTAGCSGSARPNGTDGKPDWRAVVAPVSEHGEGKSDARSLIIWHGPGPTATSLPEGEAIQIIRQELAAAGLDALERKVQMPEIITTGRQAGSGLEWVSDQLAVVPVPTHSPLVAELHDAQHRVAIKYVWMGNFDHLCGPDAPFHADQDLRQAARRLAKEVRHQGHGFYMGIFYDPSVPRSYENAPAETKRLLREQVKDFVDWLKAQGAI